MNLSDYSTNMPVPEFEGQPNHRDLKCLLDNYAGKVSETTAIFQYIYQYYILQDDYKELAELLKGIAVVEMTHHEWLGEAIVNSGGDPIIGGNYAFWSGSSLNYTKNPINILRVNIDGERQAIANYKRAIVCLQNKSLKDLIARIIVDEELHVQLLQGALDKIIRASDR
ncbi:MAG: ferritin family protein [Clostridia bacterium]